MQLSTSDKDFQSVQQDAPSEHSGHRGSIYEIVPPGEKRMSVQGRRISVVDNVFGEIKNGGPNYRNVSDATTSPLSTILQILINAVCHRLGGWVPQS